MNKFNLPAVLLVGAILCGLMGCTATPPQRTLRQSYTAPPLETFLKGDEEFLEVEGEEDHSFLLVKCEEGPVFWAMVRKGNTLGAAIAILRGRRFTAFVPRKFQGGRLLFFNHTGHRWFGGEEYFIPYSSRKPDFDQGILLEPGQPGVKLLTLGTRERQESLAQYQAFKKASSPSWMWWIGQRMCSRPMPCGAGPRAYATPRCFPTRPG